MKPVTSCLFQCKCYVRSGVTGLSNAYGGRPCNQVHVGHTFCAIHPIFEHAKSTLMPPRSRGKQQVRLSCVLPALRPMHTKDNLQDSLARSIFGHKNAVRSTKHTAVSVAPTVRKTDS